MLGKGLESLIPPQKNPDPANGQDQSQPTQQSQPAKPQPSQTVQPIPPEPEVLHPAPMRTPPAEPPREAQVFEKAAASVQSTAFSSDSIFHIEVEKIVPNPSQPRRDFNQQALHDLASSIREFGLLQPLVVTKIEKETVNGVDVEYQIIAGERRFLASKILGLRTVPAIIRQVKLEREKLELAVIENIQRENLNPVEVARSFQRLQEEFHLTQREIASKLGKSRETVANAVRLLDLPAYIQEALQKGDITESHGRLLLAVDDPAAQKKLFDDISLYRLTTRDVKERVERLKKPNASGDRDEDNLPPEVQAMKDSLSQSLGAPVEIKKGVNTGRISITFYSQEELENILRRLGKEGM
jgi:ParB family transcriptional regulator, chromosome partitioning protein